MSWFLWLLLLAASLTPSLAQLSGDGIALLAVKKALDPSDALSGWNAGSVDPCLWAGVSCAQDRRVTSLNLTGAFLGTCSSSHSDSWENVQTQQPGSLACLQGGSCILEGVLAPEIGNLSELRSLVLGYNRFRGGIPREISKLRKLQVLSLQENSFSGGIPAELGALSSLEVLDLEGNLLDGPIPPAIASCRSLVHISLGRNKLSGGIPASLGGLSRLRHLSLTSNQLSSVIPPGLQGLCGTLEYLDLGSNFFIRGIPPWLGNCSKLQVLVLESNYLQGFIPSELGRLGMLQVLDVSMNRLTGQVPAALGDCLELSFLVLTHPSSCVSPFNCTTGDGVRGVDKAEFNQFDGPLPSSISKLPKLQVLWAPHAALTGGIPDGWGACERLRSLNLAGNSFTGDFPQGLGKCSSLTYLDLSLNRLEAQLPPQLPTSCMIVFNVSRNSLSGDVLPRRSIECNDTQEPVVYPSFCSGRPFCGKRRSETCLSSGLIVVHDISGNNFSGPVPAPLIGDELLEQEPVYELLMSENRLAGNIPSSFFAFCGRFKAFMANLSDNQISGELSGQDIGGCKSLVQFSASNNLIEEALPKELGTLGNLSLLDLSRNRLSGSIPGELGELQMLTSLFLANNSLVGDIPEKLGQASSLSLLDLSGNTLNGTIPSSLANLSHLEYLLLNNNDFSGTIPPVLSDITSLVAVNLAFNNFSGSVPSSGSWVGMCDKEHFQGNPYLKPCPTSLAAFGPGYMEENLDPVAAPQDPPAGGGLSVVVIVAITSGCAVAVVLLVLVLLVQCTKQRVPRPPGNRGGRKEVVIFTNIGFRFTYENVVRATGNFSVDYLIGNGGFGATYKAEMMPGLVVAVKRLSIGRFQGVQQFDTEIRTLGRIQHSNLVKLIGYHASEGEMFLIYNYFPRGNLESFIHNRSRGEISWAVVHRIAMGIAEALAYLHDECQPRVLHRDIKPSNILLDNNLTAFLADFGLARLLGASETHATTDVAGTFGYVAPEYAMTCRVSDKADVYSYGVVLLELLSGKKALDPAFSDYGHGFTIVGWACLLIGQGRAHEVFIVELWEMGPEAFLLETLKLAVMCTVDSLTVRPTMRQVVDRLRHMDQSSLPFS
ncbi:LRR receptor-like serine/threonine-protein kinase RPK2 [Selaginella moellendorffii]|uniref:LRR receptor-like serine/threonine-protein kinase RPK2 n=1 Tax=Selaginella moellendorffii TaxID=88036 RepID=UPI000D1CCE06|nr:LRR receptor-like serine/threonine-protein kinase RPK2 [Selaginella moellendorffii]|eukprot:XP_024541854.1 LRR receptor-like serine/threonine-protein kinase RPK2 [Selaginella moellendorffii]